MTRFGLPRSERLKSRKAIEEIFSSGKSFSAYPIRVSYTVRVNSIAPGIRIGVAASKKNFRKAVERNHAKRLLREAYRLQKPALQSIITDRKSELNLFFLYTGKTRADFREVYETMTKVLEQLRKKLE